MILKNDFAVHSYLGLDNQICVLEESIERLKQSNEFKDKLLAILSHDINSPINSIKSFLQLLNEAHIQPCERQSIIENILSQIEDLKKFTGGVLRWSKIQSYQLQLNLEYLNLQSVVEEVIRLYSLSILEKKINIHLSIPEEIIVYNDAEMLKTVLRNLTHNAIKFVRQNGSIYISARMAQGAVSVSVRDNGVGIPHKNIDKLFDVIHLSTNGTKGELGTGLGLALCREFVEKMNGQIFVTSTEGEGSTFEFTLPQLHNA